jgi:hypothetical protein
MSDADKKLLNKEQDFEITPEMESKVQVQMDAMNQPDDADLEGVPRLEKKDEEEEVKDEEKEVEEETEEEEEEEVKDEEEEVKDGEVKDDSKEVKDDKKVEHVLPENYFQAMRHVGWEPEKIKETFEKDPEQALKDFKFYHDSQNYITQRTSDLGRTQKAATERATEEAMKKEKPEFKGVDLKAVEDELGEDSPAAVAIIKAMNESQKVMYDEIQSLKQQQVAQAGPSDEQKVIWNTIVTHFDSDDMKGFEGFYGKIETGKNWEQSLTGTQLRNRMGVINEADAYHAGMKLQGKDVEFSEALRRAHLVVSAPIQETILREQLHGKIKKRSKGITVKSSGRKPADDTSKKDKTEKGLIARTKQRMKKLTGKTPDS